MSIGGSSVEKLQQFLREAVSRGKLPAAAARSRLNAIAHLAPHFTEEEQADVTLVDPEKVALRVHKLGGAATREQELTVYRRRLEAALQDFAAFQADPERMQFTPGEHRRIERRADSARFDPQAEEALSKIHFERQREPEDLVSIPIRADRVVYVHNLPRDLSKAEAQKIATVLEAYASDE